MPTAGKAYQVAAADRTNKTVVICSVPYATEDSASEDNKANALNFVSDWPPASVVLRGLPISNRFK